MSKDTHSPHIIGACYACWSQRSGALRHSLATEWDPALKEKKKRTGHNCDGCCVGDAQGRQGKEQGTWLSRGDWKSFEFQTQRSLISVTYGVNAEREFLNWASWQVPKGFGVHPNHSKSHGSMNQDSRRQANSGTFWKAWQLETMPTLFCLESLNCSEEVVYTGMHFNHLVILKHKTQVL